MRPDVVLLDGKHDYIGRPWTVRTLIKADLHSVSVAAASVIARYAGIAATTAGGPAIASRSMTYYASSATNDILFRCQARRADFACSLSSGVLAFADLVS